MLFVGQFVAAIVLPTWILISRGLFDDGIGWELLVYLLVCPALSVVMFVIAGIISLRGSVRATRAVSWLDAGLLTGWYLSMISYGLWASGWLATLIVLFAIALFWAAIWQFFTEARSRFRGLVAGFEEAAAPRHPSGSDPQQAPQVIIIDPPSETPRR